MPLVQLSPAASVAINLREGRILIPHKYSCLWDMPDMQGGERDSTESRFSISELGSSHAPNGSHQHEDLDEAILQLDRELVSDNERRAENGASSRSSNDRHSQPPQRGGHSAAPSSHVEAAIGHTQQQSNGSRFKQVSLTDWWPQEDEESQETNKRLQEDMKLHGKNRAAGDKLVAIGEYSKRPS
eukprot:1158281-Pelagomonas_calceolata.AAC.15